MSEPLYEIAKAYQLALCKTEEDDVNFDEVQKALDTLNDKFIDKATNIVRFIKNLEGDRDALAAEARRLTERKRAFDNKIEWLKNYLKNSMELAGTDKIRYALFTIYVANSHPSVEVKSIDELDEQFIKFKKEADKAKILQQVKSTGIIPAGVEIVNGKHLVIR